VSRGLSVVVSVAIGVADVIAAGACLIAFAYRHDIMCRLYVSERRQIKLISPILDLFHISFSYF